MANVWRPILAACALLLFGVMVRSICGSGRVSDSAAHPTTVPSTGPSASFAVVELFTSEGCSSCPPAERVLAEALKDARAQKHPVFALAFHVDYWNRLGWRDRLSSPDYSARQQQYADAHHASGVYTPQMIVNGLGGFVGSDATEARGQIQAALARPSGVELTLSPEKPGDGHLRVQFKAALAAQDSVFHVALVEREIVVKVERGENSGRTLTHVNVVRCFATASLSRETQGIVDLHLPANLNLSQCALIGFVQDAKTMSISGATGAEIPS